MLLEAGGDAGVDSVFLVSVFLESPLLSGDVDAGESDDDFEPPSPPELPLRA